MDKDYSRSRDDDYSHHESSSRRRSYSPRDRSHSRRDDRSEQHYEYDDGRNNRNEGNTLHVGNISSRARVEDLEELFAPFGKIQSVTIPMDKDGYNRGFAFVVFEHVEDASKALNERLSLLGRDLNIQLSRRNAGYKPTPGVYMGRNSQRYGNYRGDYRDRDYYRPRRYDDRYHERDRDYDRYRDSHSRHEEPRDYRRDRSRSYEGRGHSYRDQNYNPRRSH